jgi:ribonuclease P protein component
MERLKRRRDFQAAAKGARTGRSAFVLQTLERADEAPPRLGLTVTKRTAQKAVERNRIRRRLREAANRAAGEARPGRDYVLVGRRAALGVAFDVLVGDIAAAFRDPKKREARDRKHGGGDGGRSARSNA